MKIELLKDWVKDLEEKEINLIELFSKSINNTRIILEANTIINSVIYTAEGATLKKYLGSNDTYSQSEMGLEVPINEAVLYFTHPDLMLIFNKFSVFIPEGNFKLLH